MEVPAKLDQERLRFYDGGEPPDDNGVGEVPPDPSKDVIVVLDRQLTKLGKEAFVLRRRIAYRDRHCGQIIVPPTYKQFTTDLTSVPALFTWLVPKTGTHLPAALIHDGLIGKPDYIAANPIDRVEADRIFRDGMADTGTPLLRRWLVWTAVTLATMWSQEQTSDRPLVRVYYRWIMVATMVSVAWLGYVCTADLFDRTDSWWLTYELPWMGDRMFITELATGMSGAIVIPTVLGVLWAKFRKAGWIAGIGVAVLLHVTVGIIAITALYAILETVARKRSSRWLLLAACAFAAASVTVFVVALV